MKRASRAARIAAAVTPPAIPPICAVVRLLDAAAAAVAVEVGEVVDVATIVLLVVEEELVVLVAKVDDVVDVEVADVVVEMTEEELVFEIFVDVVLVSGTKTDPETTTSVAVKVACVSGAALVTPSHMPYAFSIVEAERFDVSQPKVLLLPMAKHKEKPRTYSWSHHPHNYQY